MEGIKLEEPGLKTGKAKLLVSLDCMTDAKLFFRSP